MALVPHPLRFQRVSAMAKVSGLHAWPRSVARTLELPETQTPGFCPQRCRSLAWDNILSLPVLPFPRVRGTRRGRTPQVPQSINKGSVLISPTQHADALQRNGLAVRSENVIYKIDGLHLAQGP